VGESESAAWLAGWCEREREAKVYCLCAYVDKLLFKVKDAGKEETT
jgi:hypothetical protein